MKSLFVVLALSLIPLCAGAADYQSSFGYSFSLSADWVVMTPKTVAENFESKNPERLGLSAVDSKTLNSAFARVKQGKVEYYFDRKYSAEGFDNNISAQLVMGSGMPTEAAVKSLCATLAPQLRATYGAGVQLKRCEAPVLNGIRYVSYEYYVPRLGGTIVQREIPYPGGTKLVLAGASNSAGLEHLKSALSSLERSVTKYVAVRDRAGQTSLDAGKMLSRQEQVALVQDTIHHFALAVNAKDFSSFHQYISEAWRRQITVAQLDTAFRIFMDDAIDLRPLDGIAPVFSPAPTLDKRGVLELKGYYPTRPVMPVFDVGYVYEDSKWRLAEISLHLRHSR